MNINDIQIDQHSKDSLHLQIVQQVRNLIATEKILPGDHLPPVRQLAEFLGVNQNTILKAYLLLEQERIVVAHKRGGTVVTARTDDPNILKERQRRLADIVGSDVLKALSMGYSPEDIEANFHLQLARWREERQAPAPPEPTSPGAEDNNTIRIVGSHDMALNILVDITQRNNNKIKIQVTNAGSLGGLIALQEERAHLAGIHLLDEETGEYNYPYVKKVLPGREVAIVHLAYRIQGLMFARGNPKNIKSIVDLKRPDVTFVNRQQGAGTRVLLDINLRQMGIKPKDIKGYDREMDTHVAVGLAVAHGEADAALGIEAAARSCNIDFLPLFRERYDLIIPMHNYRSALLSPLLRAVTSEEFKAIVEKTGGYDVSQTGATSFL
jgi:molybdate-binding protein/DNA-binding transcriptional regulator YhcF (GntR family)